MNINELNSMNPEERAKTLYEMTPEMYKSFLELDGSDQVQFSKIFTHVHTDMGSPMDAILTIPQYIETAKKMGTKYLTVTDHGTMYGVQTLYDECKSNDLELIIGVEFYVCDDDVTNNKLKHTRLHLVGYAKDKQGYLTLSRLVTESNYRIITVGKQDFPCISRDLLMKYMGPGTEGHGHVILTSACIGGVLTGITFEQETLRRNIEKLLEIYSNNKRDYDMAMYAQAQIDKLEEMKASTSDKDEKAQITAAIKSFKANISACNTTMNAYKNQGVYTLDDFAKYLEKSAAQIEQLKSEEIPAENIEEEMKKAAEWYDACAGHGNFYIEIQYHGISTEQKYEHLICGIAHELNVPLISGIDAHMQNKEDARSRKYINALRFSQFDPVEPADEELYLKTDGDLYRWLKKAVVPGDALEAMDNRMRLAEQCHVVLEKENHYPIYPMNKDEEALAASIPDMF